MTTIELKNQGPIEYLSIPLNPDGGVTVLRASNGAGKSQALEGVRICLKRSGALNRMRGAGGPAEVTVGGATARSGSRTSHTGELEVASIEDRLSIADLVDPQIANPVSADAKRIKAILSLTSAKADFSIFETLLSPGVLKACTQPKTRATADLIEMAAEVKKDMHEAARAAEDEAQRARGAVATLKQALAGIDLDGESDERVLRERHTAAIGERARVNTRAEAAKTAETSRVEAEAMLNQAIDDYDGPAVDEAAKRLEDARTILARRMAVVAEARRHLEDAEQDEAEARRATDKASTAANNAQQHEKTIQSCRAALSLNNIDGPTPAEVTAAEEAVSLAEVAIVKGVRIRDAKGKAEKLDQSTKIEADQAAKAKSIRDAAAKVDEALSRCVQIPGLTIVEGRLWSEEHKDYFGELSEGQKITIALGIVLPIVGEGGILPLPQAMWEGLDPKNKLLIDKTARKHRVAVLTAEAADGPIRAEEFKS